MWNVGGAARFYDEFFPDDSWVMPYEYDAICDGLGSLASEVNNCYNRDIAEKTFVTHQTNWPNPTSSPTYRFSGLVDIVRPAGTVNRWDVPGMTLEFPQGRQLIVEGELEAEGVTFTAADPAYGWDGIRFESGATGHLQGSSNGPTVVSEVSGYSGGASIYIQDATVTLDDVILDGRVQQPADYDLEVAGIWATGNSAQVTGHEVDITPHTSYHVVASGGALVRIANSDVDGDLFAWGYLGPSDLYVWDTEASGGTRAQSYGLTWHGWPDSQLHPYPNNTIPSIAAVSNAESMAGSLHQAGARNNRIFEPGVAPGYAISEYYSDVTAEYAYWGQSTGPDLSQSNVYAGSTFDYCPFISNPATGALNYCGGLSLQGSGVEATAGGGEAPAGTAAAGTSDELYESARWESARGRSGEVVEALEAVLADRSARAADVRRRALGLAARAAARATPRDGAALMALIAAHAARGGDDLPWSLRALASAQAGRGDVEASLATAREVTGLGGDVAVHGHLLTALASAALGRADEAFAALERARVLDPDGLDVRLTELELGLKLRVPFGGDQANTTPPAAEHAHAAVGVAEAGVGLGMPRPNPARGEVVVPVALEAAGYVRVSVHDVLGREVALVHEGHTAEGTYSFVLDAGRLAPGTYVVRAVGAVVAARTLTVAR